MHKTKVCPKCGDDMNVGNFTGTPVDWEKESDQNFLKNTGKKIFTYACVKCGYLESYVSTH